MVNYESELSEIFLDTLTKMYGIEKKVVYHYFYLRFLIEYYEQKIDKYRKNRMIVDFLLKELNVPLIEGCVIYKGERIRKYDGIENSIANIIVNWEFRSSLYDIQTSKGTTVTFEDYMEKERKRYWTYGRNKAKAYRGTPMYSSYFKWNALTLLNEQYHANVKPPVLIEGIEYPKGHNIFARTLEEVYYADIHSVERKTTNTATITESDLEQYLIQNLSLIEEGLQYIDRQYCIKDGRIDILARDKDNNYVILELKVQEDKELIWQSIFYPIQFKREHHVDKVRMITVAPYYPNHILIPLKQIDGVEIVAFQPLIELGRIKQLTISRIN